MSSEAAWRHRRRNDFENAKAQCLGKRDKSFQGRIDARAVEVCGIINERDDMYTTSSCAGRCFLYRGAGVKATTDFSRFRISHEKVHDPQRYFNLSTIDSDPTGGGDPIRTVGQYDYKTVDGDSGGSGDNNREDLSNAESMIHNFEPTDHSGSEMTSSSSSTDKTIWLRYEPFILHVACRSLSVASLLMSTARPSFKNVGLTTWKDRSRYLVAIWGDEGLEMPLCTPTGVPLYLAEDMTSAESVAIWLAQLCNERHERNWSKIQRFCQNLREMMPPSDDDGDLDDEEHVNLSDMKNNIVPRSFDVIGDIAYLHSIPKDGDSKAIGEYIMRRNKSIRVVVARMSNLEGIERAPGEDGLEVIAGARRSPLITTHTEYGIKCVVDLSHTFFSPRMGQERLRICQQVARGERVLVCFGGVGMDAIQIAGRTEATSVVYVELNKVAVECAKRSHRMLERNKGVKCAGAADRLKIIYGDVLEVVPALNQSFDRILAPRPKEGKLDSDLGAGDGGARFLKVLLPRLKDHGECHWYDFVADWEYPSCDRTKALIKKICTDAGLKVEVIHVAKVGSVAMRQLRICMDFKVFFC